MRYLVRGIVLLSFGLASCGEAPANDLETLAGKAREEAAHWQQDAVLVEIEAQQFIEIDTSRMPPVMKSGAPKLVMLHFVSPKTGRGLLVARTPAGVQKRDDPVAMKKLGPALPQKFLALEAAIDKARQSGIADDRIVSDATLRVHAQTESGKDRAVWTIGFGQDPRTGAEIARQIDAASGALTAVREEKPAPEPTPERYAPPRSGGLAENNVNRRPPARTVSPAEEAKALNARGTAAAEAGNADAALRDFREAARLAPGSAVPVFNEGLILKRNGDLDAALTAFDRALTVDSNYAAAYMERGLIFLRWGEAREAAAEFDRGEWLRRGLRAQYAAQIAAAQKGPRERPRTPAPASPSFAEGVRLIVVEHDREAVAQLSAVIARDAGNADAWLYRAKAYYNLRQDALALDDLKEAVRLRPGDAETHRMLGRTLIALGEVDRGLAEYGAAIRADPGFAMAYVDRGAAIMEHYPNRVGSAQKDFQAAIDADPTNPYAWYNRSSTYGGENALEILQGKASYDPRPGWSASIKDLSEAIRLKPDFAEAYASRGLLELAWAMFEKDAGRGRELSAGGRADIERALTLKPSLEPEVEAQIDALQDLPSIVASVQQTFDSLRAGILVRVPAPRSSDSAPCANYRGGAAAACRAQDWMATDRYNGGRATGTDRRKYGDY